MKEFEEITGELEIPLISNPIDLCTDNAAMIAWMGWEMKNNGSNVDLRQFDSKINAMAKIPLGSFTEDIV